MPHVEQVGDRVDPARADDRGRPVDDAAAALPVDERVVRAQVEVHDRAARHRLRHPGGEPLEEREAEADRLRQGRAVLLEALPAERVLRELLLDRPAGSRRAARRAAPRPRPAPPPCRPPRRGSGCRPSIAATTSANHGGSSTTARRWGAEPPASSRSTSASRRCIATVRSCVPPSAVFTNALLPSAVRTTSAEPGDQPPARLALATTGEPSACSIAARTRSGSSAHAGRGVPRCVIRRVCRERAREQSAPPPTWS